MDAFSSCYWRLSDGLKEREVSAVVREAGLSDIEDRDFRESLSGARRNVIAVSGGSTLKVVRHAALHDFVRSLPCAGCIHHTN
jgi:hypothetical protein